MFLPCRRRRVKLHLLLRFRSTRFLQRKRLKTPAQLSWITKVYIRTRTYIHTGADVKVLEVIMVLIMKPGFIPNVEVEHVPMVFVLIATSEMVSITHNPLHTQKGVSCFIYVNHRCEIRRIYFKKKTFLFCLLCVLSSLPLYVCRWEQQSKLSLRLVPE